MHVLMHLYQTIESILHPNGPADANCKDPISLKKLRKWEAAWLTWKTILGWDLNIYAHLIRLPEAWPAKVCNTISAIPESAHIFSLRKRR